MEPLPEKLVGRKGRVIWDRESNALPDPGVLVREIRSSDGAAAGTGEYSSRGKEKDASRRKNTARGRHDADLTSFLYIRTVSDGSWAEKSAWTMSLCDRLQDCCAECIARGLFALHRDVACASGTGQAGARSSTQESPNLGEGDGHGGLVNKNRRALKNGSPFQSRNVCGVPSSFPAPSCFRTPGYRAFDPTPGCAQAIKSQGRRQLKDLVVNTSCHVYCFLISLPMRPRAYDTA